jgi:hypothetical protein
MISRPPNPESNTPIDFSLIFLSLPQKSFLKAKDQNTPASFLSQVSMWGWQGYLVQPCVVEVQAPAVVVGLGSFGRPNGE